MAHQNILRAGLAISTYTCTCNRPANLTWYLDALHMGPDGPLYHLSLVARPVNPDSTHLPRRGCHSDGGI